MSATVVSAAPPSDQMPDPDMLPGFGMVEPSCGQLVMNS